MFSRFLKIDCNLPVINKIRGYKMKNFKRVILMISMFAITGASVNCSFRSRLERRSARLRRTVDGQEGTRLSVQLSDSDRGNRLRRDREVSIPTRVTESSRLWLRNEFPELTQDDSIQQIRLILNDDHEKQNEFSEDFIEFIKGHFRILNSGDLYFDPIHIANTLTPSTNFDQLRLIYLDSILANIEFIRNLFEAVFFLRLNIKSLGGDGDFHILSLSLSNFLRSNLFENAFEAVSIIDGCLNIHTPEEDLCVYNDDSDGVVNGLMFDFNIEQSLDSLEYINEYLQIDFNFVAESFIRDIENSDLESIEIFVQFVVRNFEEDRATEIFNRCLRILNPEYCDIIIWKLSNVNDKSIFLSSLNITAKNITAKQLSLLLPRLGKMTNFTDLNVSDNQLTELPESIGNLTNLTYLYLNSNQLTELPESIGNLTNLTGLRVSNNQLTELPESVGQLGNLQYLNLSDNQLIELPESIGNLTNLIALDVSNNQLTGLPESIGYLTNLIRFYLYSNQLIELPDSFRLTSLEYLDLRSAFIEGFDRFYLGRQVVQDFMNSYFNR